MVCAPNVDHSVVAALELVQVVRDVGGEIGECAVFPADHAVLLVAEGRGAKPEGAVFFEQVATGLEHFHRALDVAAVVQRLLREPAVVHHAEGAEVVALVGEHGVQREPVYFAPVGGEHRLGVVDQCIEGGIGIFRRGGLGKRRGVALEAFAVGLREVRRDRAHIVGAIAVLRKGDAGAQGLQVAQPDRCREDVHLPAGVVDVKLALYFVAAEGKQVRQARAIGRAASMTHMERASGVGRHEFDLHLLACGRCPTEGEALGQHAGHDGLLGLRRQAQVDESRAGDLDCRDIAFGKGGLCAQGLDQAFRELARVGLELLRQLHGDVAGEVPVLRLLGAFEQDRRVASIGRNRGKSAAEQPCNVGFDVELHKGGELYLWGQFSPVPRAWPWVNRSRSGPRPGASGHCLAHARKATRSTPAGNPASLVVSAIAPAVERAPCSRGE